MTIETRYVGALNDVERVHVVCTSCRAAVTCPVKDWHDLPKQCPNCGTYLFPDKDPEFRRAIESLMKLLKDVKRGDTPPVRIELDFGTPTQKVGSESV